METFLVILVLVLTILILVVIHELGHFIACRIFDIKVLEFGFGIPPRVWGKMWGETLVSINALPIGGFVRPLGEDEEKGEVSKENKKEWETRSFQVKPVWQRIVVVLAGVVMNLVLAFVLFWIILASTGFKAQVPLLSDFKFFGANQTNETAIFAGNVVPNSPAGQAGLKAGERIVEFNNQVLESSEQLIDLTKQNAGKEVEITLSDPEKTTFRDVRLTPRQNPPEGEGAMGVSLGTLKVANVEYVTPLQKIYSGPVHSLNLAYYSLEVLFGSIGRSVENQDLAPVSQNVAGPVGIFFVLQEILKVQENIIPLLNFVALLSLSLGIMNILPFPALDGGRIPFLLIEGITKKKVPAEVEARIHSAGFMILLGLIFLIAYSDIQKFIF